MLKRVVCSRLVGEYLEETLVLVLVLETLVLVLVLVLA